MPKREGIMKDELLCTRVTSAIRDSVVQQAQAEGLSTSEWMRNLIVKELKERQALPRVYTFPAKLTPDSEK